jgi:hypothetical protein
MKVKGYNITSRAGTYGISHNLGKFSGVDSDDAIRLAVKYYTLQHNQCSRPEMLKATLLVENVCLQK